MVHRIVGLEDETALLISAFVSLATVRNANEAMLFFLEYLVAEFVTGF